MTVRRCQGGSKFSVEFSNQKFMGAIFIFHVDRKYEDIYFNFFTSEQKLSDQAFGIFTKMISCFSEGVTPREKLSYSFLFLDSILPFLPSFPPMPRI